MRGASAILVFLVHLRLFFLPSLTASNAAAGPLAEGMGSPAGGQQNIDFGHKAVIVFFVLSGFLVGGSVVRALHEDRWSWKRYLVHRLVRLWMVLLPALVLCLALDNFGLHHFAGQGTIYSGPPSQEMLPSNLAERLRPEIFLGNLFFLQEILVKTLGTDRPLWSLSYEFWYYLAFPLLAIAAWPRGTPWRRLLSLALLAGILLFVGQKIALYFAIWLLGVAAAMLPLRITPRMQRPFAGLAAVVLLAIGLPRRYHGDNQFPVDLLFGILVFAVIYGVSHLRSLTPPGGYARLAHFVSRISYSLYLTHAPVLCLMSAFLVGTWRVSPLNSHTVFLLVKVTAIVFLVACGVHFLFEARTDKVRSYLEARL